MAKPYQHHDEYHDIGKAVPKPKRPTSSSRTSTLPPPKPLNPKDYTFKEVIGKFNTKRIPTVIVRRVRAKL